MERRNSNEFSKKMSIKIQSVEVEEFKNKEKYFLNKNFLQSADYYRFQKERGKFLDLDLLVFSKNNEVIAGCLVLYRKRYRFF